MRRVQRARSLLWLRWIRASATFRNSSTPCPPARSRSSCTHSRPPLPWRQSSPNCAWRTTSTPLWPDDHGARRSVAHVSAPHTSQRHTRLSAAHVSARVAALHTWLHSLHICGTRVSHCSCTNRRHRALQEPLRATLDCAISPPLPLPTPPPTHTPCAPRPASLRPLAPGSSSLPPIPIRAPRFRTLRLYTPQRC